MNQIGPLLLVDELTHDCIIKDSTERDNLLNDKRVVNFCNCSKHLGLVSVT
jgi:hypothetical protein